jgi:hypothetical protein
MPNNPSLLPDDYKEKEDQAKEAVSRNMKSPDFDMHLPEKSEQLSGDKKKDSSTDSNGVVFGEEKSELAEDKKGKFVYSRDKKVQKNNSQKKSDKRHYQSLPEIKVPTIPKPQPHLKKLPQKPPHVKVEPRKPFVNRKPVPKPPEVAKKVEVKVDQLGGKSHLDKSKEKIMDKKDKKMRMRIPNFQLGREKYKKQIVSDSQDEIEELTHPHSVFDALKKDSFLAHLKNPPAEMNLIHEDYKNVLHAQFNIRIKMLLLILFIFLILFGSGFVFLNLHKINLVKEYSSIKENVTETNSSIDNLNTEQMQTSLIRIRLEKISEMLDAHLYWTKLFDYLEHNTVSGVYYTDFVAEEGKSLSLLARAPTYRDLATQLVLLENADFVESVDISGGNLVNSQTSTAIEGEDVPEPASSEVEFTINLKLKDSSLLYEK